MIASANSEMFAAHRNSYINGARDGAGKVAADEQKIIAARDARALFERVRSAPNATAGQLERARAVKVAAEAAAPDEIMWGAIERSAAFNRAQQSRHGRGAESDDQVIGRLSAHLAHLEERMRIDQERLDLLEAEQRTRPGTRTRTDPAPPPRRRAASEEQENEYPIDPASYEQNQDYGPEL